MIAPTCKTVRRPNSMTLLLRWENLPPIIIRSPEE
jgi:hypothetical protein